MILIAPLFYGIFEKKSRDFDEKARFLSFFLVDFFDSL